MSNSSTDDLRDAISQVQYWRGQGRSDLAEKQIQEILAVRPGEINASFMLAVLRREAGDYKAAIEILGPIVKAAPGFNAAWLELAAAQRAQGELNASIETLQMVVSRQPAFSAAWRRLGDALIEAGKVGEGREAFARSAQSDPFRAQMAGAMKAMNAGQLGEAESGLQSILQQDPEHIYALIGLATLAIQTGQLEVAQRLLDRCEQIAGNLDVVWQHKARLKFEQNDFAGAEAAARRLTELAGDHSGAWHLLGDIQSSGISLEQAPDSYRRGLDIQPGNAQLHVAQGHALRALGQREEATAAFRTALKQRANYGEAYWALSDMKTEAFTGDEISALQSAVSTPSDDVHNTIFLQFALGKALEGEGRHEEAFTHFEQANDKQAKLTPFNPAQFDMSLNDISSNRPEAYQAASASNAPVPIFIVGLPRSGSTLVEQILAAHSQVESTMELPHMPQYAKMLAAEFGSYGEALERAGAARFAEIGQSYINETEGFRTGKQYFIDKLPSNFMHIPLITRALPNAVIIDVRRNPLDCGLSCFKQYFSQGQVFSYRLDWIAHFYRAYVGLMAGWQTAAPGRVHLQSYEQLVDQPEDNIRALLTACGLEFEANCLTFHTEAGTVRTASSEQVRKPINAAGIGRWARYRDQLKPLIEGLGPELTSDLL